MATTKYPILRPELTAGDLRITIWPDSYAEYVGTRQQLQDEGLIPEGLEWPRADVDKHWQSDGFKYWLRRTRPEGLRGPKRTWLEMDNWFVRVEVVGHDLHWRAHREIERKRMELMEAMYDQTTIGRREREANWRAYWCAQGDTAFQLFKSRFVPERRKPGRPSKRNDAQATE